MNIYNVRKATLALATYLQQAHPKKTDLKVAISHDSRHFSRDFAKAAAEVLAARGCPLSNFLLCMFIESPRDCKSKPEDFAAAIDRILWNLSYWTPKHSQMPQIELPFSHAHVQRTGMNIRPLTT